MHMKQEAIAVAITTGAQSFQLVLSPLCFHSFSIALSYLQTALFIYSVFFQLYRDEQTSEERWMYLSILVAAAG